MPKPRVVRPKDLAADAGPTARMTRLEAFAEETVWMGQAGAAPGEMSDWHHHGDRDTYAYCVSGRLRLESGPGGRDVVELEPGDFIHMTAHVVHREGNPGTDELVMVVIRIGEGPLVFNVDGPDPSE